MEREDSISSFKEMIKSITQKMRVELDNIKLSRLKFDNYRKNSEKNLTNLLEEVRKKLNEMTY